MPIRIIGYDRGTRSQLEDNPVPPSESSPPGEYLNDRIVVVTGAFGALGAAVAQAVGAAGAQVAAVGREEAAKAPAFASGVTAFGGIDLGSPDNVGSGFRSIAERLGGIDALINIAGGFRWEKIDGGSVETWEALFNVNLRTTFNATKAALPYILKRAAEHGAGRIVNVGAAAANHAAMGMGAYAASKAGVEKFTEALAAELKDRRVTVNAIAPSIIDTAANRAAMPNADFSCWVTPLEISRVIVFLLSTQASGVTGALIPVTGRV
jgi:NAD(P)-dependent dehydrogenase (short-subunit alcohol dehydrogenase family)